MKKIKFSLEKLEPVIERIEKLSTVQRILIYTLTFILIIGLVGWFGVWPKWQQIDALKAEKEDLDGKLIVARRNAAQLPKLKAKMEAAQERFKLVMRALPETQEIPSLLTSISMSGKEAGLQFMLFQPGGEASRDFYAEIPVAINVLGGFHNVVEFFDRVASLNRIVNIKDIKMAPTSTGKSAKGELNTTCTAVTYKFVDKAPADKKKRGKKK